MSSLAKVKTLPEYCKIYNYSVTKQFEVPLTPQYFFRHSPVDNSVFFSTFKKKSLGEGQNFSYDYDAKKLSIIPGPADAVPNSNGTILTVPFLKQDGKKVYYAGIEFYQWQDLSKGLTARPIYIDYDMKGKYQSLGVLNVNSFRLVSDYQGLSVRDYELKTLLTGRTEIVPLNTAQPLCKNLNENNQLQLPMVSKDGKILAAYDVKSKSTKLFLILQTYNCTLLHDLGIITGKVDFNFENNKIVFFTSWNQGHEEAITLSNAPGSYFQHALKSTKASGKLHLYEFSLSNQLIRPIYTAISDQYDLYFPTYTKEGNIISYAKLGNKMKFMVFKEIDEKLGYPLKLVLAPETKALLQEWGKQCTELSNDQIMKMETYLASWFTVTACKDFVKSKKLDTFHEGKLNVLCQEFRK